MAWPERWHAEDRALVPAGISHALADREAAINGRDGEPGIARSPVDMSDTLRPPAQPSPRLAAGLEPWLPVLAIAWALGVLLQSARLLGGWLVVQDLIRRGSRPVDRTWVDTLSTLSERLGLSKHVRLLESAPSRCRWSWAGGGR